MSPKQNMKSTTQHNGISLLEVLAAIFVVGIGLLGVLAVIPFGAFQVSQANHAKYASSMLANAAEEVAVRRMANPMTWGVARLLSDGELVFKRGNRQGSSTLNCTQIIWIEPSKLFDPPEHIICIGMIFRPQDRWKELMRGQDDLVVTAHSDRRPDFSGQNDKILSSGSYTWFFSYQPQPSGEFNDLVERFVNMTIALRRRGINRPATILDIRRQVPFVVTRTNFIDIVSNWRSGANNWSADNPRILTPSELETLREVWKLLQDEQQSLHDPHDLINLIGESFDLNENVIREIVAIWGLLSGEGIDGLQRTVSVDILACHHRISCNDVQVPIPPENFSPSYRGGTFALPQMGRTGDDRSISIVELLTQTNYVFVTWQTPGQQPPRGTWCKIVFLDKSNLSSPRIVVTGDLPGRIRGNANMQVFIPSGVLFHKKVEGVPVK